MHFHLPKPMHGWREFVGEVGIIVIGVLIALGAESLLEDWRWHSQIGQANEVFKDELGTAAGNAYERLAIQGCLTNRLKEVAEQLNKPGSAWRGMPANFNGAGRYYVAALPVVYRPPTRTASTAGWASALTDGTINHLPQNRAMLLAESYNTVQSFMEAQREEALATTKLSPLANDRTLSADARLQMLQVVSELDSLNDLLVTDSRDFLTALRAAHLGFRDAEVQKTKADLLKLQEGYRGSCVKALSLHLN